MSEPFNVAEALGVEEYLNRVNYSVDPGYVPSDFALEFVTFIKLVNGAEGEENLARLVRVAVRRNIGWLTVFGFSTANCSRSTN